MSKRIYVNITIGEGRRKKFIQSVGVEEHERCVWVIKDGNKIATKIKIGRLYLNDWEIYSNTFDCFVNLLLRESITEQQEEAMIKTLQKVLRKH